MNDTLHPNEFLFINQMLTSPSGEHVLILQSDGNLVLYEKMPLVDGNVSLDPIWATDTFDQDAWYATMQADGNFVICNRGSEILWESGTNKAGSFLLLRDDGKLVINDVTAVWEADTEEAVYEPVEEDDMEMDVDDGANDSVAVAVDAEAEI